MDKISDLKEIVINTLDLNKAQDIVTIDLKDKSSMADYMIIASGTSSCLLYTSPSPRDPKTSRMPSSA